VKPGIEADAIAQLKLNNRAKVKTLLLSTDFT
jgi:hypothetical protein